MCCFGKWFKHKALSFGAKFYGTNSPWNILLGNDDWDTKLKVQLKLQTRDPFRGELLCLVGEGEHGVESVLFPYCPWLPFGAVLTPPFVLPRIGATSLASLGYGVFFPVLRVNCAVGCEQFAIPPLQCERTRSQKYLVCAGIKQGCEKLYYSFIIAAISWGFNEILSGSPTGYFLF